jgi:Coenzyme PQQ synthesis protein D (PqqD)
VKTVQLESKPRRSDEILVQRADENQILLDPSSGEYYTLNDVGARVWELADGTRAVSDIVAVLSEEYDAAPERLEVDVLELLGDLAEERLVTETPA